MTRSTLQPLRSRRHLIAFGPAPARSPGRPAETDAGARSAVAAIGLIWVAAAGAFAPPVRGPRTDRALAAG